MVPNVTYKVPTGYTTAKIPIEKGGVLLFFYHYIIKVPRSPTMGSMALWLAVITRALHVEKDSCESCSWVHFTAEFQKIIARLLLYYHHYSLLKLHLQHRLHSQILNLVELCLDPHVRLWLQTLCQFLDQTNDVVDHLGHSFSCRQLVSGHKTCVCRGKRSQIHDQSERDVFRHIRHTHTYIP